MKRIVALVILSITIASPTGAQWRKIADFRGHDDDPTNMVHEIITCVYFLDLPGPPRIGFAGTETELYKTTDGGVTWRSVWDSGWSWDNYYVTDICFKDSLTGWFTVFGGQDACYRTIDGGAHWTPLVLPEGNGYGGWFVNYSAASNRLFLSLADEPHYKGLVSNDLGDTWQLYGYSSSQYVFFSDSIGISGAVWNDSLSAILKTSDAGLSWDTLILLHAGDGNAWSGGGGLFLPICESSTCFEADGARIVVRRSDDYGRSWRVLKDFGPVADTNGNPIPDPAPYGTGVIEGNLSHLYIQTGDSGMYVSTDEGKSWFADGGPSWSFSSYQPFYAAKGVTIVGGTTPLGTQLRYGTGLWEETWPQSGVAELPSATSSNDLRIFPNPATNELQILGGPAGTVRLFDLLGRERAEARDDGSGATLEISHLEAGAYFVRCGNQSAKVEIAH